MQIEFKSASSHLYINHGIYDQLDAILRTDFKDAKKIIITDENVFNLWIEQLITAVPSLNEAELIQLPAGEDTKCIEIAVQIWESLADYKVTRKGVIINFGGGMISDLGGFIAATYKRGISFINIPTTLLSQVDASIGGKNGIDLGFYKNMVGTFSNADHILINPDFLATLSENELLSGYGEMLKHGLIHSKSHWDQLKTIKPDQIRLIPSLIYDSIIIKKDIVEADPHEKNIRKSLNFGHTVGHAIEGYFLNTDTPFAHGIAIAWGMVAEAFISYKKGLLNKAAWDEIYYVISDQFPKIGHDDDDLSIFHDLMENDKKNNHDQAINFTLISDIGKAEINHHADRELISESLRLVLFLKD